MLEQVVENCIENGKAAEQGCKNINPSQPWSCGVVVITSALHAEFKSI